MPDGGCFCGKVRISYSGEPAAKVHPCPTPLPCTSSHTDHRLRLQALCHCTDCRKITGSTYSTNVIIPGDQFKLVSGTPKTISKKADSGKQITSHFCGDCGSTLFRQGETFGDAKVIKVGVMDDVSALEAAKPEAELYAAERIGWVGGVGGAKQLKDMPGSAEVA